MIVGHTWVKPVLPLGGRQSDVDETFGTVSFFFLLPSPPPPPLFSVCVWGGVDSLFVVFVCLFFIHYVYCKAPFVIFPTGKPTTTESRYLAKLTTDFGAASTDCCLRWRFLAAVWPLTCTTPSAFVCRTSAFPLTRRTIHALHYFIHGFFSMPCF